MNNPFDYTPDDECSNAFRELTARLETLKRSRNSDDVNLCRELEAGKMLGVLIAADKCGVHHTLYAFSGQLGGAGFSYPGFVAPVFDYLQPDGYFKTREKDISRQNVEIDLYEEKFLSKARIDYDCAVEQMNSEIAEYKKKCRVSKMERDARRESGMADTEELAAMTRQSQFEKAELHRLKKRLHADLEPFEANLRDARNKLDFLKERRRADSEALQKWLFSNFRLLNALGDYKSLNEIFSETSTGIPPSGAGECCAPKLLQAAYIRGWKPVSIAEYWYGRSKGGEVRIHGEHYPACRGKCLPVLGWMLRGLDIDPPLNNDCKSAVACDPEIIYENEWFCVVDKPGGMLSVPGKGDEISVQQWLIDRYGSDRIVKVAHRLDQDTSGLLIATFGQLPYKLMQSLFAKREVKKCYVAVLEGDYKSLDIPCKGSIDLPLSPDWLDRPRQRVDFEGGKDALTDYRFISVSENRSRIAFYPRTGRTHQLRVHAASEMGIGMPIVGDRLYGINTGNGQERLHLHAQKLEFTFPIDGRHYCFESPTPF